MRVDHTADEHHAPYGFIFALLCVFTAVSWLADELKTFGLLTNWYVIAERTEVRQRVRKVKRASPRQNGLARGMRASIDDGLLGELLTGGGRWQLRKSRDRREMPVVASCGSVRVSFCGQRSRLRLPV